jgi:hypothetical protein
MQRSDAGPCGRRGRPFGMRGLRAAGRDRSSGAVRPWRPRDSAITHAAHAAADPGRGGRRSTAAGLCRRPMTAPAPGVETGGKRVLSGRVVGSVPGRAIAQVHRAEVKKFNHSATAGAGVTKSTTQLQSKRHGRLSQPRHRSVARGSWRAWRLRKPWKSRDINGLQQALLVQQCLFQRSRPIRASRRDVDWSQSTAARKRLCDTWW